VEHFRIGLAKADRSAAGSDLGDSLLGAIAPDGDAARRAGRAPASFYIPSMPPALLERHGIDPGEVRPVTEAFAIGDTLRSWAGLEVEGLPDLGEQVRIMGEQVLPRIDSL
jgi:5,10-methylenetetrahydromethanopterin reductase